MKRALTTALTLILLASAGVLAQEEETYVKDLMEVNFFGGGGIPSGDIKDFSDTVGAVTGFNIGLDAGFFVTTSFVAGFNFTFTQFSVEDQANAGGLHHKLYNPNLYAKYYFTGQSDFVPYVKANAGLDFAKFTTLVSSTTGTKYREISYDPVFSFGGGAGLFVFTTDFSGLFAEINYHRALSSDAEAIHQDINYKFDSDLSLIDIHAGIRILIGPGE